MGECFKCGVSDKNALLCDAVSGKGIVKVCEKCLAEEDIPVIRKPTNFQIRKANKTSGVYEKLSKASNLNPEVHKKNLLEQQRREIVEKQNMSLRAIVDKNVRLKTPVSTEKPKDMVDNFHWVLMRERRARKLSQKQLAEKIAEPEVAINLAEQGILPSDGYALVKKIETVLGIRLLKREVAERLNLQPRELSFDPISTKMLTLSDLKDMEKQKNSQGVSKILKDEDFEKVEDSEDYDDLIFRK